MADTAEKVRLRIVRNIIQQHLSEQCPEQWPVMLSDGQCSAGYGAGRTDAELKEDILMKELTPVERNGYITSGLDLTVRARTIQGDIVAFTVEPEGTTASLAGKSIEIHPAIASIDKIVDLLALLQNCGLSFKDNELQIVNPNPMFFNKNLTAASDCSGDTCAANASPCAGYACAANTCAGNTAPCAADGCAGAACAGNAAPCAGDGCAADACAGNASAANFSPCAGDGCAAHACAAHAVPCAADGCVAVTCAGQTNPCAADGCAALACAANVSPCAGQACAGQACAAKVFPCAGDAGVGPCIHMPYCPIIL